MRQRVALVIGTDYTYLRGTLRGIAGFAATHSDWVIHTFRPTERTLSQLKEWGPDGIIAHLRSPDLLPVCRMACPVVGVYTDNRSLGASSVDMNNRGVGVLAADHFLDRGFTQFGVMTLAQNSIAAARSDSFMQHVERRGGICSRFYVPAEMVPGDSDWTDWSRSGTGRIREWLASLPKPAAIWTVSDPWARELTEIALEAALNVPEDLAILGMGNDDVVCELAQPKLSSVIIPWPQIGFAAARMMDDLLQGRPVPADVLQIDGVGVASRESTDLFATDDPEVAEALRLIRHAGSTRIDVADLLREVGVSRRGLERRFKDAIGRTPLAEITRVRIERAKYLLLTTDLPAKTIASRSGFPNVRRLTVAIRAATGATPSRYRERHRVVRPPIAIPQ